MASRLKIALPLLCAAALVLAGLPMAEPAQAGTVTVNTPGDGAGVCPATCTLRAAIAFANPGDTIMFQAGLASPILLGSALAINENITISGPGAATLAVSGNNASRVFDIGTIFPSTVTISGLTIQNGLAPSPGGTAPGTGGAIRVGLLSSLTLSNATVTASKANNAPGGPAGGQGGGVFVAGSATLNTVTLSSNTAVAAGSGSGGQGGGIHVAAGGSATLNDSTVGNTNTAQGGTAPGAGAGGQGGGVFVAGGLTLNNTTVRGNTAGAINFGGGGQGGGIFIVTGGSATLSGSTVSGNTAAGAASGTSPNQGGGIFNGGTLMLNGSSVGIMGSGNTATAAGAGINGAGAAGGGIFNASGSTATLTNANVIDNTAQAFGNAPGSGGGIFNSATSTLTLTGVTINMNLAGGSTGIMPTGNAGAGGGIVNNGTANLTNVTISTNSATASTGATTSNPGGSGGGLFNGGGTATLLNVTVTQNLATPGGTAGNGGGIDRTGGTVNLKNSIVENNGPTNCAGTITSQGDNLSQGTSCGLTAADINNPNNPDLLLGLLQLNPPNPPVAPPGNNLTVALLPGSPAIDGVTHNACPPPATDERGVPRPQGAGCDIGAFEVQVILTATPTPTSTATPAVTSTPTPTVTPTPTATPTCILGDINCDGIVDIRDYGIWRQQFGQQGAGLSADLNQDGIVDIRDYGIWRQNFGHTAGAALRGETAPAPRGTPGPVLLAGDQAAAVPGSPLRADGSRPAVPMVPLMGGLLGLGGLAGWRRRRPRGRE